MKKGKKRTLSPQTAKERRRRVFVCGCCGRPYPQDYTPSGTRWPGVRGIILRRLVDTIADHPGLSGLQVVERLYKDDPEGGPNSLRIVSVFVHRANEQLATSGHKIVGSRGRGGGYKLIKVPISHGWPDKHQ